MYRLQCISLFLAICALCPPTADGRNWTDVTGRYSVDATLVALDANTAILKKESDRQLLSVPVASLSKADQDYLKSKEATEISNRAAEQKQTWSLAGGATLVGRVIDYIRKPVVIQARRGKIYVNDRLFENLPGIYQHLVLRVVSHFEKSEVKNKDDLIRWAARQKGQLREFVVEGVLLELEDGDVYGVPFFAFSEEDRRILEPGWQSWIAAQQDRELREREVLALQALAESYQRDRAIDDQARQLHLQLLATAAGVIDLWEVWMSPGPGTAGPPIAVVAPGRNSRDAILAAQQAYPGYVTGPARKVN